MIPLSGEKPGVMFEAANHILTESHNRGTGYK